MIAIAMLMMVMIFLMSTVVNVMISRWFSSHCFVLSFLKNQSVQEFCNWQLTNKVKTKQTIYDSKFRPPQCPNFFVGQDQLENLRVSSISVTRERSKT